MAGCSPPSALGTDLMTTPNPRAGLRVVSATARYHRVLVIGL
jgi:hypothetical protein